MDVTDAEQRVVDGVEAALDAVHRLQPSLNAFTHVLADEAIRRAAILDAASGDGPLHGVPIAVKDQIDVAGTPTTGGCTPYRQRIAERDAPVVRRLREAGAVVVAKTNMHELGTGATGLISCFGPTRNPWDPDRIAGGSSSGSAAAVAAGAVPLALGSDSGGSIRIPAAFCGVTGLRPTPGRVPTEGAMPMSLGFDTVGPMAINAALCAAAFRAMAMDRPRGVPVAPVQGLRVGLPAPFFNLLHHDVAKRIAEAASVFEDLGAHVQQTHTPGLDEEAAGFEHIWADLAHHHNVLLGDTDVSSEVAKLLDIGASMSTTDVVASRRRASQTRTEFLTALQDVDLLLVPATPYPAPHADETIVEVQGGWLDVHKGGPSRFTYVVNEAGLPAVSFPVGRSAGGLPIGAQLIGRPDSDEHLLAVVTVFQRATDHHRSIPNRPAVTRPRADAPIRESGRGASWTL